MYFDIRKLEDMAPKDQLPLLINCFHFYCTLVMQCFHYLYLILFPGKDTQKSKASSLMLKGVFDLNAFFHHLA